MNRICLCIGGVALLVASPVASQVPASVPRPDVSGPIPGRIFFATSEDLSAWGYVEEEFFLEGTARQYDLTEGAPPRVLPGEYPYRTRVVVRRPDDPDQFNGVVLLEWLNVTLGFDWPIDWMQAHEHILRSGYAWVGVTAQRVGVHAARGTGLRDWNPERYGALDLTADSTLLEDELAFDVFAQAAAAVRDPGPTRPLGPLVPRLVLATGHSQSAFRLTTYHNRVQPSTRLIDGFLIHGGGGRLADGVGTKVFKINAETDLWLRRQPQAAIRQADSGVLRTWEVAGTSHLDAHLMSRLLELQRRDLGSSLNIECDDPPMSRIPLRYVLNAAYDHLAAWIADGIAPPSAPLIELTSTQPVTVARDSLGNALGGVRLPDHAVPVATNGGRNGGGPFCDLYGTYQPFDDATLAALYPTRNAYVAAFTRSVRENLEAGYILETDADEMLRRVEGSSLGRN